MQSDKFQESQFNTALISIIISMIGGLFLQVSVEVTLSSSTTPSTQKTIVKSLIQYNFLWIY